MCFWRGHSLCRAPLTTGVDIYPRVLPSAYCVLLAHTHTHTHWTLPTTMSVLETPLQGALNHWGRILPQGPTIQNNQLKKRVCVKILDFDLLAPPPPPPPPYGQVLMLYDIWLSIYRLLKNITAEILYYGQVLDFDLWPNPLAWTLGSDVMD